MLTTFETNYQLGDSEMDKTHKEFLALIYHLNGASGVQFTKLFQRLIEHTQAHFESEEVRMNDLSHGLLSEHRAEHLRVMADMKSFKKRVDMGRVDMGRVAMARAWVKESLPQWFDTHARMMDSALAADIINRREQQAVLD